MTDMSSWHSYPSVFALGHKHLAELLLDPVLEDSPRDIGALFKEVPVDIEKECAEDIRDALFAWAWPKMRRGITAGLAEWYKDRLLEAQFQGEHGGDPLACMNGDANR